MYNDELSNQSEDLRDILRAFISKTTEMPEGGFAFAMAPTPQWIRVGKYKFFLTGKSEEKLMMCQNNCKEETPSFSTIVEHKDQPKGMYVVWQCNVCKLIYAGK
ncbi:MAG: hypothetical protein KJI71_01435 [Patescibacteria group bacterium]|nr:hypothetical protein [Patescibacteria group bacterium]